MVFKRFQIKNLSVKFLATSLSVSDFVATVRSGTHSLEKQPVITPLLCPHPLRSHKARGAARPLENVCVGGGGGSRECLRREHETENADPNVHTLPAHLPHPKQPQCSRPEQTQTQFGSKRAAIRMLDFGLFHSPPLRDSGAQDMETAVCIGSLLLSPDCGH